MSHDHSHAHGDPRTANMRRLGITLGLVLLYMGAEVVGGVLANSLALLADAGHMLSDAASLGLALFALWVARKPRTPEKSFGYHRTEILAALINGVTLVVIAVYIVIEAWGRFRGPQEVDGPVLLWIAAGGLVINLVGVFTLHGGRDESLNVKGAWLHVLADTLGSVQAIAAGFLIWLFGWDVADPVAAVLIAALVLWSSWTLLRDAVNVLMEGTPAHLDAEEVQAALASVAGVTEIHDLHIWTITSGFESLSVHARIEDRERGDVLRDLQGVVRERFGIEHATVQLEEGDECATVPCA